MTPTTTLTPLVVKTSLKKTHGQVSLKYSLYMYTVLNYLVLVKDRNRSISIGLLQVAYNVQYFCVGYRNILILLHFLMVKLLEKSIPF